MPETGDGRSEVSPLLIVSAPVELKVELPVTATDPETLTVPLSVGEAAKTLLPVPVLVTLTTFLLESSAKAVDAVRPDRVVVPETARLTKEPEPPDPPTLVKSVPFHATITDSPLAIVTPVVGPTPRNTIDCVPPDALITV